MRKELYKAICEKLQGMGEGVIQHIDLWNHNVEFIEQEEVWGRPAVFVEFGDIDWEAVVHGVRYVAEPKVRLHIVTDWKGGTSAGSAFEEESLEVFDLTRQIHEALCGLEGEEFKEFDLQSSQTNHNHEDIVETIEEYGFVAYRLL